MNRSIACLLFSSADHVCLIRCKETNLNRYDGWKVTGGTKESTRYSSLKQIDSSNVGQLAIAWEFHTGDADTANHSQNQCNPIVVDGIIYATSPRLRLFAIDAATRQREMGL